MKLFGLGILSGRCRFLCCGLCRLLFCRSLFRCGIRLLSLTARGASGRNGSIRDADSFHITAPWAGTVQVNGSDDATTFWLGGTGKQLFGSTVDTLGEVKARERMARNVDAHSIVAVTEVHYYHERCIGIVAQERVMAMWVEAGSLKVDIHKVEEGTFAHRLFIVGKLENPRIPLAQCIFGSRERAVALTSIEPAGAPKPHSSSQRL